MHASMPRYSLPESRRYIDAVLVFEAHRRLRERIAPRNRMAWAPTRTPSRPSARRRNRLHAFVPSSSFSVRTRLVHLLHLHPSPPRLARAPPVSLRRLVVGPLDTREETPWTRGTCRLALQLQTSSDASRRRCAANWSSTDA